MRYPIFKAKHPVTSMEGVAVSFSDEQLAGIAKRYDPALHEAPITVGHPAHDAPAYGWIKSLSFADGQLSADEHQVNADFMALRKAGSYKKLSARFYTPASPNNPTPGDYYLRDVGFLGAMPPAVKGLKLASFADGSEVVSLELSFGDLPGHFGLSVARMFKRLRDRMIDKEGLDEADKILPAWEVESLSETAQRADMSGKDSPALNSFAEPAAQPATQPDTPVSTPETPPMKTPEQLQAELDAANAALATERQSRLDEQAAAQTAARKADALAFADGLLNNAQWAAGDKDLLVDVLVHVATPKADGSTLSFGDGDAALPMLDAFKAALQKLPASVSFGEIAGKTAGTLAQGLTDREVADRARAHKQKTDAAGGSMSFADAVDAVHLGKDQA